MPGMVATPLTGRKDKDWSEVVISAEDCATGILRNANSVYTYGGTHHELTGLLMTTIVEFLPLRAFMAMGQATGIEMQKRYVTLTAKPKSQ